ncbi:hypothetical protein [Asanoa siamensis]|uniref:Uncharacterized protein n=1 Tax=Asanoa siamensis TaxID=926357 RepID=A0ABQ4CXR2_9ACTN|nr:hypothetical protein [Asanoa siamensis]GIF76065.1 hypothetical protein Asi02nite_55830 [Asanoa siamensis]
MARVVVVHGIRQHVKGPHQLRASILAALLDGLAFARADGHGADLDPESVAFAFYGDVFRSRGEVLAPDAHFDAVDVETGFEQDLLLAWWRRAAEVDRRVVPPEAETLGGSPRWVQSALRAMTRSRFFMGLSERLLIGDLKQVRSYLFDPAVRQVARDRVATCVSDETEVVVGHSLGSVVAYEALCAHPEWPVRSFVTLGSPLGLRHLIFDRLEPPPKPDPATGELRGGWPGAVTAWTNVADRGDVVAVEEDLRIRFGDRVRQIRVDNGASAHDIAPYLSDRLTGAAIADGLDA